MSDTTNGLVIGFVGLATIALGLGAGYVSRNFDLITPRKQEPVIVMPTKQDRLPTPTPTPFGPVPHVTVTQLPAPTPAPIATPAPAPVVVEKQVVKPKPPVKKVVKRKKASKAATQLKKRWSNGQR